MLDPKPNAGVMLDALCCVIHIVLKASLWCWKKGCLLLTEIKANTVNACLLCEILKILVGNMLDSMKESPSFYPF